MKRISLLSFLIPLAVAGGKGDKVERPEHEAIVRGLERQLRQPAARPAPAAAAAHRPRPDDGLARRLRAAQEALGLATTTNADLNRGMADLRRQLREGNRAHEEATAQATAAHQEAVARLRAQIEEAQRDAAAQVRRLEQQLRDALQREQESAGQYERETAAREVANGQLVGLQAELAAARLAAEAAGREAERRVQDLEARLAAAQAAAGTQAQQLEAQLAALRATDTDHQANLERLQQELDAARAAAGTQVQQLEAQLVAARDQAQREIEHLQQELATAQTAAEEARTQSAAQVQAAQQRADALEAQLAALRATDTERQATTGRLQQEIDAARAENRAVAADVARLQAELTTAQSAAEEASRQLEAQAQAFQQLADREEVAGAVQTSYLETIEALQQEIAEARTTAVAQVQQLQAQLAAAEEAGRAAQQRVQALEAQLAEEKAKPSASSKRAGTKQRGSVNSMPDPTYLPALRELTDQVSVLGKQLKEQCEALEQKRAENDALRAENDQQSRALADAQRTIDTLQAVQQMPVSAPSVNVSWSEVDGLKDELRTSKAQVDALEEEVLKKNRQVQDLEGAVAALSLENSDLSSSLQQLAGLVEPLQERIGQLEEEGKQRLLDSQTDRDYADRNLKLQDEIDALRASAQATEARLREENETLKEEIDAFNQNKFSDLETVAAAKEEVKVLEARIRGLESALDELTADLAAAEDVMQHQQEDASLTPQKAGREAFSRAKNMARAELRPLRNLFREVGRLLSTEGSSIEGLRALYNEIKTGLRRQQFSAQDPLLTQSMIGTDSNPASRIASMIGSDSNPDSRVEE